MSSSWMRFTLDDLSREREIYGRLTFEQILRPMWVAAINISKHDPERGLAIMRALTIIALNQTEKEKAASGKLAAGARGGADFELTPLSLLRARQTVNV